MKIILFGATGMVGQGALRECLLDPDVTEVLIVGRCDGILDVVLGNNNADTFDAKMPAKSLIAQLNPQKDQLRAADPRLDMLARSEKMDFIHPDAAPAAEADEIVWKTVKGPSSQLPKLRGMAGDKTGDKDDED